MAATTTHKTLFLGIPSQDPTIQKRLAKLSHIAVNFGHSRGETIRKLQDVAREHGPFHSCVITAASAAKLDHLVPANKELFGSISPECKFFTGPGAGYDKFDTEWSTSYGASYFNSPTAVAEPTATTACLLVLGVLRGTIANDRSVRAGKWKAAEVVGREPRGLVLGLYGMGTIAKIVAKRMAAFDMKIHYHSRRKVLGAEELGYVYHESLESLLKVTDVLSIHCPITPETHHSINADRLCLMKEGSFIVNTARGDVIDETALLKSLESGHIVRAGLDVFSNEPEVNPLVYSHPKITLSPHNGAFVQGLLIGLETEMFDNLEAYLKDVDGKAALVNCVSGPRSYDRL